jgi:hypothetical protein
MDELHTPNTDIQKPFIEIVSKISSSINEEINRNEKHIKLEEDEIDTVVDEEWKIKS